MPKLSRIFCAGLILLAGLADAQTLRVTTWDLDATKGKGTGESNALRQAALELGKLAPDVVLLRGVAGWKMCSELAAALKPAEYRVVACSAFGLKAGAAARQKQVAILARNVAYYSWSEAWDLSPETPAAGGFAFAAVQIAGHRFGFTSMELAPSESQSAQRATAQWLAAMGNYRSWANNRLEGFVGGIAGISANEGESGRLLRVARFTDAGLQPAGPGSDGNVHKAHLVPNTTSPPGLTLSRWGATWDLDFRPAPIAPVVTQVVTTNSVVALTPSSPITNRAAMWLIGALALVLVALLMMQLGTRRKLVRLQAEGVRQIAGPVSETLLITDTAGAVVERPDPVAEREAWLRQGLFAHLAQWLKQTFLERLLRERKEILAAQEAASMKVSAVDERLARLEARIQEKNASYEKQIEKLNRELLTARAENRELIRAQINTLKTEMANTRAQLLESEAV